MDCIFCKIVNKDIPASIIYENEQVLAFDDINAQAPIHKLIIPKQHIATTNDLSSEQAPLIGQMILAGKELAAELELDEKGYRLVLNCNADGGQTVFHIHLHLLGGRKLTWPPG